MADITSVYQTYNNAGSGVAQADDNYGKHVINQADVGRELIIQIALTNMTDADVTAIRNAITLSGGVAGVLPSNTGDAFTIAAIGTANGAAFQSGVTDNLFMRVQGTGTFDTTDAAAGTGATVTVLADFRPAL